MTRLVRAARRRRSDDGYALVLVLTSLCLFSLVVVALLSLTLTQVKVSGMYVRARVSERTNMPSASAA